MRARESRSLQYCHAEYRSKTMSDRLRSILIALTVAVAISLVIHFLLFAIVFFGTSESSLLLSVAEGLLAPAGAIIDRIGGGHSFVQVFYGFLISGMLYTLAIWPLISAFLLLRKRV